MVIKKVTLEESLSRSEELWTWLTNTGARKKEYWPMWEEYGVVQHYCWTCEYAKQQRNINSNGSGKCRCDFCVTYQLFGDCRKGTALGKWDMAQTVEDKVKYAKEVLTKVRKIKEILGIV